MYVNRRARYDYELQDRFEAGVSLTGSEVKSLSVSAADFRDAFVSLQGGNAELEGLYIAPYFDATYNNHEPRRRRRLLLNRHELDKLRKALAQKGLTAVPTAIYRKGRHYKVEIAIARGRRDFDKRGRGDRERLKADLGER